jgi:hypothetical protein
VTGVPEPTPPVRLVTDLRWGAVHLVVTAADERVPERDPQMHRAAPTGVPPPGAQGVGPRRAALAGTLGVDPARLQFLRQVHGDRVVVVPAGPEPEADAAVITGPGYGAAVLAADCLPLLLADPTTGVAAAAHVGRRGLQAGIAVRTVETMRAHGADRIRSLLGPSICGRCYEVPAAMREEVEAAAPGSAAVSRAGTPAVDIEAGVRRQLLSCGVTDLHAVGRCTAEDPALYSYRRDGVTGRIAGAVAVLARPA